MRYYGFKNNKGNVIVTDVLRDKGHYDLSLDWDLEEFIRDVNSLYSQYGVLHGFKHQLRDDISSLKELDAHFRKDENGKISCFSMIRSKLINIYERLYDEPYVEVEDDGSTDEVEVNKIYFSYHEEDNDKWGQITFQDDWNVNLGVFNFDDVSFDEFKKMFELWERNIEEGIYIEFEKI